MMSSAPAAISLIPSTRFTEGELIGKGGFGAVHVGKWKGVVVAIKKLFVQGGTEGFLEAFQKEAQVMAGCQHPNIVRLYGICTDKDKYAFIMEFMEKGSLFHLLQNPNKSLSWSYRFCIATDIGNGLIYLHDKGIVHRDLKSLNILIDKNGTAKISDFGLAKVRLETTTASLQSVQQIGTARWMAPELFEPDGQANKAADVYSLGIILWEIASRTLPFKNAANDTVVIGWKIQKIHEKIPKDCPEGFAKVIQKCWEAVDKRPPVEEITAELSLLHTEQPITLPTMSGADYLPSNTPHAGFDRIKPSSLFSNFPIYDKLLDLSDWWKLAEIAKKDLQFKQQLWDLIEQSKRGPDYAIAGANAASIWNLAYFSFSRKDLRGARLPGACLEKANLVGADLRNADLRQVSFAGVNLSYANLDGANLEGVEWGQWPIIRDVNDDDIFSSADGKRIIGTIYNSGNCICIWETESGKLLKSFDKESPYFNFTPLAPWQGGKQLVALSPTDKAIHILDLETGTTLQVFEGHNGPLASAEEDKKLVYADNKTIIVQDLKRGKIDKTLQGHDEEVTALATFDGGKKLISGSKNGTICIWDLDSGAVLQKLEGHKNEVTSIKTSKVLKMIASRDTKANILFWDLITYNPIKSISQKHSHAFEFLETRKQLAFEDSNDNICILDLTKDEIVQTLEGHNLQVRDLTSLEGGKRLASCGDFNIRIWDLDSNQANKSFTRHIGWVEGFQFVEGGKKLVSFDRANALHIRDLQTGELESIHELPFRGSRIMFDGGIKILAFDEKAENDMLVYDVENRKTIKTIKGIKDNLVYSYAARSNPLYYDKRLVCAYHDGIIRTFDLDSGNVVQTLDTHIRNLSNVVALGNGSEVALGCVDGTVSIWDFSSGKKKNNFQIAPEAYGPNLYSLDDGKRMGVVRSDGKWGFQNRSCIVEILELVQGKVVLKLETDGNVCGMGTLNHGKVLILAVDVGDTFVAGRSLGDEMGSEFSLWDLESGHLMFTLKNLSWVSSYTFTEPASLLVGDYSGNIHHWKFHFSEKGVKPELLWSTYGGLVCVDTQLGNAIGLSDKDRKLIQQHGFELVHA